MPSGGPLAACDRGPGNASQDRVKIILTLNRECSFGTGET